MFTLIRLCMALSFFSPVIFPFFLSSFFFCSFLFIANESSGAHNHLSSLHSPYDNNDTNWMEQKLSDVVSSSFALSLQMQMKLLIIITEHKHKQKKKKRCTRIQNNSKVKSHAACKTYSVGWKLIASIYLLVRLLPQTASCPHMQSKS